MSPVATRIIFIYLVLVTFPVWPQAPENFIRGYLVDPSNAPVSFATVSISNSTIGTAADGEGAFFLRIDEPYRKERVVVSCIGYLTKTFPIDSLLRVRDSHRLVMRADNPLLSEILVKEKRVSASDLVREAVQAVERNYLQQPFNLELYSVIEADDSVTGKNFTVETVLSGYYQGYRSGARKKFEILQKRTTGEDPLTPVDYIYWPSFEILSADLLTSQAKHGIFNLDRHDEFVFRMAGVKTFGNDTVFHITYHAPKPNARISGYGIVPTYYRGSIFITTSTFAVVRHEIETSSFAYHIIYRRVGDYYFPYYISGTRVNVFKLPGGKREFKTYNSLTVTDVRLHGVKTIDDSANETNVHRVKYDEAFWARYLPKP